MLSDRGTSSEIQPTNFLRLRPITRGPPRGKRALVHPPAIDRAEVRRRRVTAPKSDEGGSIHPSNNPSTATFPIVGIGASAGGLEAFTQLLKHLPNDTGLGFVLVQHLDPQHESALTQLLTRVTSIPVREVTNNLQVEPNHIYVIPPIRTSAFRTAFSSFNRAPTGALPLVPSISFSNHWRRTSENTPSESSFPALPPTAR